MKIKWLVGTCHEILAKSPFLVYLAAKIRNQTNRIIGSFFAENVDPCKNSELWLIRLTAPEASNFIDVGANIGNWTAAFLGPTPESKRGLLFEPSGSCLEKLKKRFQQLKNIEIINAAAGDKSEEKIFFDENGKGLSSSVVQKASMPNAVKKTVKITMLDAELEKRAWDYVDFLKIDAEGYDLHVLRGASAYLRRQKIGIIQFEYHGSWKYAGSTLAAAVDFLESFGYKVFSLKSNSLFRFDYELYGEYFSYANYVAVSPEKYSLVEPFIKAL